MREYKTFFNVFCFLIGLLIYPFFCYAIIPPPSNMEPTYQGFVEDECRPENTVYSDIIGPTGLYRDNDCSAPVNGYAKYYTGKYVCGSRFRVYYEAYRCSDYPDENDHDGIKNNGEVGIDCGGSTGVNCVQRCPYGFILDDGVCVKSAGMGPNPDGGDDIPYINPVIQATPILASPDLTILDDQWVITNNVLPSDGFSTSLIDNTSSIFSEPDYVIRDNSGSVVASQLTGDLQSTDNGDGTRSEVQSQTTYNPITNVDRTSTQTNIYNSETNELISSNVSSSGSSSVHNIPNAIESGLGSGKSLSGDQYAHGNSDVLQSLADIKSAIDGDPDDSAVDVPAFAVEGVDFDGTLSPDDIPEKLSIPDTISDFVANSPLFILLNSLKVDITNPQCKFTVDGLSFFGKSMSLDFDMCRWQDFLQSLGAFMLMFTQALAVIVIFRGFK